jgi:hypothetical protein
MRLTVVLLGGAASLYVLALTLLFLLQQKLMFVPERLPASYRFQIAGPFEERFVGEEKLHSLYFPALNAKGTILYFHGNAGSLAGWGPGGEALARQSGFNVWMLDYPGYGKSEGGLASESGLYAEKRTRSFPSGKASSSRGEFPE